MLVKQICIYCGNPMKLEQVTTIDEKPPLLPLHNYWGCEDCNKHIPLSPEDEVALIEAQEAAGQLRLI